MQAQALLLTMMSWDESQRAPLKDRLRKPVFPGEMSFEFASFQTCDYIDIECVTPKAEYDAGLGLEQLFAAAHRQLSLKRAVLHGGIQPKEGEEGQQPMGLHIQQSLTLLGESGAFWEEKPKILFLSLVHLQEGEGPRLQAVKEAVQDARPDMEGKFALYHTVDFCDLVLCGKNMCYQAYMDLIWKLLSSRESCVCDTISLFCLEREFLVQNLKEVSRNGAEKFLETFSCPWNREKFSLSVDVRVRDSGTWNDWKEQLSQPPLQMQPHRIIGRNDARLDIAEASLGKLLATISLLDCATVQQGLTGYEIIPMLDGGGQDRNSTGKSGKGFAAQPIQELWDEYHEAAKQFYPGGETRYLRTPSEELYRSLHTLDANGLANEFTLCVLPSLKGYTKTCQIYADAMAHPEKYWENDEPWVRIEDSLEKLRRDYFHALSVLVQSTMHGERKFVQAPAFNCTAFDIPPKLLALYCSVIYWITQTLNDNNAREFYFLLAPGFRDDIYVQPLSMRLGPKDEGISHPHNLLIIHLNEKLFYEPSRLLGVLCHEISHHVGGESRRRKERARCIFRSLAMYIVCKTTPLIRKEPEETPHRLIEQIVEAMADVMLRYYEKQHKNSGLEYYITDLADFLTIECGWMGLLQMPAATAELIQNMAGRMYLLSRKGGKDELCFLAQLQDNLLHSNYVQSLLENETTCYAAFDLMSRHVVRKLYSEVYNLYNGRAELVLSFHAMIEMTLQVHSEAYSDDRMIRLMGLDTREKYEYFLHYYSGGDPQNRIRYEAVVRAFYPQNPAEEEPLAPKDEAIEYFFSYTRKQVSRYLKHCEDYLAQNEDLCQKMTFTAQRLNQIAKALRGEDVNAMFDIIHKEICAYKQALI